MSVNDVEENVHHVRLPLLPNEDLEIMRDAVREFLQDVLPEPNADCAAWSQIDPNSTYWHRMATELGLQGLLIPEALGGQGFGISEASIVFEELGRALCSAPLLSTTLLAGRSLQLAGPAGETFLTQIAAGDIKATANLTVGSDLAVSSTNEPRIDGTIEAVIEGLDADILVALVGESDDFGLYVIDLSGAGVSVEPQEAVDLTRSFARIHVVGAPAQLLAPAPHAREIARRALDEATVCLSAESVGAARRALASAVEYSKTRQQFGQPIGSFQALKHRMADMLMSIEGAWSTVRYAAVLVSELDRRSDVDTADVSRACSVAKVASDKALAFASAECIQIHGGIGFTWEYTPHLIYRRAASNAQLLGSARTHRSRLVELQSTSA
jgi:alkylation response protein AidB-like acyl-CoA dehydrogenase